MIKYILVRIMLMFVAMFAMMTVVFFVAEYSRFYYWVRPSVPRDQVLSLTWESYLSFVKRIFLEWDWGMTRLRIGRELEPVWEVVTKRVPVTLAINLIALFIYTVVGFTLGLISSIKKNGLIDRIIGIWLFIINSVPSFIFLFILILIFGIRLQILPTWYRPFELGIKEWSLGLIMPMFALCMAPIAHITMLVRAEFIETMETDFMQLAKVKGLSNRQILIRHGIKNAMAPITPSFVTTFVIVLANSIIIEEISKVDGIGRLFLKAVIQRHGFGGSFIFDINVAILIILYISLICLTLSLIMDVTYRLIDPRVRIGSKK